MSTATESPPRDSQLENLIDRWPELSAEAKQRIAQQAGDALRRRLHETLLETGPLTVGSLAVRLRLPGKLAAYYLDQLRATGFITPRGDRLDVARQYNAAEYERAVARLKRDQAWGASPTPPAPAAAATSTTPTAMPDPPARHDGATSQAAAEAIRPCRQGQQQAIVAWLKQHGEGTREQIAAGTGIDVGSVCPRITELLAAGIVRKTTRTRKTSKGRGAGVLELTGENQNLLF